MGNHGKFTMVRSLIWLVLVIVQSIHDVGLFSVGIILVLLLDCLHEFIQLTDLLVCIESAPVKSDNLQ